MYPSSREVVSLRQLEERVRMVRTNPRELTMQANKCTPCGFLLLLKEGSHLLSLSDDELVLEVIGGMLHHGEVDHGAGQKDDNHGVGEG